MKGAHDQDESSRIRDAVNYLHGRLEIEIDYYCERKGIPSLAVAPLVGAALVGAPVDHLSAVPKAPRDAYPPAPALEVAGGAHGRGASPAARRAAGKAAPGKVTMTAKQRAAIGGKSYWAGMTPAQKSKEMTRRQEVAAANRKLSAASVEELKRQKRKERDASRKRIQRAKEKAPRLRKDAVTDKQRIAKQAIYVERSRLRKEGKSEAELPPLPPRQGEAAEA